MAALTKADLEARALELGFTKSQLTTASTRNAVWQNMLHEADASRFGDSEARIAMGAERMAAALEAMPS